jgi:hypothetical protein
MVTEKYLGLIDCFVLRAKKMMEVQKNDEV